MKTKIPSVSEAEQITKKIALGHYENFPVGSILIPKKARQHFYNLYAFMRTADDFADDEGRPVEERLALLADWRRQLEEVFSGVEPKHPIFIALHRTIRDRDLKIAPLGRLLDAFTFDVYDQAKFFTEDDLAWYTERSAAPVGELVLALFNYRDAERIKLSNNICSALQLVNFIQDAKEDLERGRCYFPSADMPQSDQADPAGAMLGDRVLIKKIVRLQLDRAIKLLSEGEILPSMVTGRLSFELRVIISEAKMMIDKIEKLQLDTLVSRPKLSKFEHLSALIKALL
jgi:squalene synthase HpnC